MVMRHRIEINEGMAHRDSSVLKEAARLVMKYNHPSQLGTVPNERLAEAIGDAEMVLILSAKRAERNENDEADHS